MDVASQVAQPSGLEAWLSANGALIQVVLYATQALFWIAMIVFIGYAVFTYKRYCNYQMGIGKSGQLRTGATDAETEAVDSGAVAVDEFVD